MANRMRDARKEAFWRGVLRRQKKAGVSVREFCRREGVGESNFYAWRRAIGERDVEGSGKRKKKVQAKREEVTPAFVPIVSGGAFGSGGEIVLELGGGRRLRFDAETSTERLVAIVRSLGSESEGAA